MQSLSMTVHTSAATARNQNWLACPEVVASGSLEGAAPCSIYVRRVAQELDWYNLTETQRDAGS